jgi:hypothetical protein
MGGINSEKRIADEKDSDKNSVKQRPVFKNAGKQPPTFFRNPLSFVIYSWYTPLLWLVSSDAPTFFRVKNNIGQCTTALAKSLHATLHDLCVPHSRVPTEPSGFIGAS